MLSGVRLLPSSHMVEGLIIELVFYDKTMKLSLSLSLLFFILHNIHHTLLHFCSDSKNQTIAPHLRAWGGSVRWESVRQERGNSFDPMAWTGNAGRCRGSLEGGRGEEIRIKQRALWYSHVSSLWRGETFPAAKNVAEFKASRNCQRRFDWFTRNVWGRVLNSLYVRF